MQAILIERVEKLGNIGDLVEVKNGYARNYLFPRKKAVRATKVNIEAIEAKKADLIANDDKMKAGAEALAKKLDGTVVVIIRQAGESGQLYGSVSSRDIAVAIKDAGHNVNKDQVLVDRPIKSLGVYDFQVRLHAGVRSNVLVNIAKTQDEAGPQLQAYKDELSKPKIEEDVLAELEAETAAAEGDDQQQQEDAA